MNPEEYAQLFRLGETHWWFVGTRDVLFSSAYRDSLRGEPILDVGCGSGLMMKRFTQVGPVFGIDSSSGAIEHCHSIGFSGLCRADAGSLPFRSGVFGLVIAADLLEHCGEDEVVLSELYRVTRPRGILLVSVPACGVLWSAHDVALHHKRRYSKAELIRKVESVGFTVGRLSHFNSLLFVPVAAVRLTLGKLRKRPADYRIRYHENLRLLGRILLGVMRVERWLLGRCNLPFGLSMLLLAVKERE
ncbi:MAG: class I SAM-dependent methyltransferase [Candidatus Hydrogenedentota bacterium]|nr:MAG: class I SAM-dependent methyltransferase [Candidatus Hydrogenedentota bacterium]